jgi:hypothetical protein
MADYRMPESLRCPRTGQTWNMRVSDDSRLERVRCEACGEMHTLNELLNSGKVRASEFRPR